ncbi:pentapeptide repeat-containing protein [Micromonospora chalcea]|uniref:pentapeptide repeat-containing protein n=1 Tax=Micromonospora chalcea TaxID=1874 RepID=UPI0033FFAD9B
MTKRLSIGLPPLGVALLLLAVGVSIPEKWWAAAESAVAEHWGVLALASLGVLITGTGLALRHNAVNPDAVPLPPTRPIKPFGTWLILAGAVLIAAVSMTAVLWLESLIPTTGTDAQRAQIQISVVRTGLSLGAGVAGTFALLLALRRQQLAERTQQATEYDAGEKRVTELYMKAADQLGSEKPPVRLASLYALERLAQDNPTHRQSITNVICAYLRMPDEAEAHSDQGDRTDASVYQKNAAWREVRVTAQQILGAHLRRDKDPRSKNHLHWKGVHLNLAGATLLDADFNNCHLTGANFTGARFVGDATFTGATFYDIAWFDSTKFENEVNFSNSRFMRGASFESSSYADQAYFRGTEFQGPAVFNEAAFHSDLHAARSNYQDDAWFVGVTVSGMGYFSWAQFSAATMFTGAEFRRSGVFHEARFFPVTDFTEAQFFVGAALAGATVEGPPVDAPAVWPLGWKVDSSGERLVRDDLGDSDPPHQDKA